MSLRNRAYHQVRDSSCQATLWRRQLLFIYRCSALGILAAASSPCFPGRPLWVLKSKSHNKKHHHQNRRGRVEGELPDIQPTFGYISSSGFFQDECFAWLRFAIHVPRANYSSKWRQGNCRLMFDILSHIEFRKELMNWEAKQTLRLQTREPTHPSVSSTSFKRSSLGKYSLWSCFLQAFAAFLESCKTQVGGSLIITSNYKHFFFLFGGEASQVCVDNSPMHNILALTLYEGSSGWFIFWRSWLKMGGNKGTYSECYVASSGCWV